jgi:hypothetical protein
MQVMYSCASVDSCVLALCLFSFGFVSFFSVPCFAGVLVWQRSSGTRAGRATATSARTATAAAATAVLTTTSSRWSRPPQTGTGRTHDGRPRRRPRLCRSAGPRGPRRRGPRRHGASQERLLQHGDQVLRANTYWTSCLSQNSNGTITIHVALLLVSKEKHVTRS